MKAVHSSPACAVDPLFWGADAQVRLWGRLQRSRVSSTIASPLAKPSRPPLASSRSTGLCNVLQRWSRKRNTTIPAWVPGGYRRISAKSRSNVSNIRPSSVAARKTGGSSSPPSPSVTTSVTSCPFSRKRVAKSAGMFSSNLNFTRKPPCAADGLLLRERARQRKPKRLQCLRVSGLDTGVGFPHGVHRLANNRE